MLSESYYRDDRKQEATLDELYADATRSERVQPAALVGKGLNLALIFSLTLIVFLETPISVHGDWERRLTGSVNIDPQVSIRHPNPNPDSNPKQA